jgi:hypothetical protein
LPQQNTNAKTRFPLPAWLCVLSLAVYVVFSQELHTLAAPFFYHLGLVKLYLIRPPLNEGISISFRGIAETVVFAATCLVSGFLLARMLGKPAERIPWVILGFAGAAIFPMHVLAAIWWPDGRGHLTSGTVLLANVALVAVLALLSRLTRRAPPAEAAPEPRAPLSRSEWWFVVPGSAALLSAFFNGWRTPLGYDSIAYHLPLAAAWLKSGRLTSGYDVQFVYPSNTEWLLRWTLAGGTDAFSHLVSWLSAVGCVYLLFAIARRLGQSREAAIVSAFGVVSISTLLYLAASAYTDLFMVLNLLLAVFFLVSWLSEPDSIAYAFGIGMALGLALGAKYSALPAAAVIVVIWIFFLYAALTHPSADGQKEFALHWRLFLSEIAALGLALLSTSAFWYVRNWIEYGSPVFPIKVGNWPGLPIESLIHTHALWGSRHWMVYPWLATSYGSPFDDGLGGMFAACVPLCLVLYLLVRGKTKARTLLLLMALVIAILYGRSGGATPRYLLFPVMLGFLFVGMAWDAIRSAYFRAVVLASFLLMAIVLTQSLAGGYLYHYLVPRVSEEGVPAEIDRLPAATVFNAAGQFHTYAAMGRDYRHEVITLFHAAKPEDVRRYSPDYVVLRQDQVAEFAQQLPLELVARGDDQHQLSLWKIRPQPKPR